jgi:hypothetical protein
MPRRQVPASPSTSSLLRFRLSRFIIAPFLFSDMQILVSLCLPVVEFGLMRKIFINSGDVFSCGSTETSNWNHEHTVL